MYLLVLFGRVMYLLVFSISHDDSGFRSDWLLDKVIIDCPSLGKSWTFPCNRWLAKGKDDGKTERELFPQNLETEEYTPCKALMMYYITRLVPFYMMCQETGGVINSSPCLVLLYLCSNIFFDGQTI
jgi:hypothetical protein